MPQSNIFFRTKMIQDNSPYRVQENMNEYFEGLKKYGDSYEIANILQSSTFDPKGESVWICVTIVVKWFNDKLIEKEQQKGWFK